MEPQWSLRSVIVLLSCLAVSGSTSAAVVMDWVDVGDPGNPQNTVLKRDGTRGFGAVDYSYRIGKYEVTNFQYTEFLNSVAITDTYSLYSPSMSASLHGGITRTGFSGSYTYSVKTNMGNKPANYVSWFDSARFANWLHNGQPFGKQDASTTEDGAYTFSGFQTVSTRNSGARVFLPNEHEWDKAAFYEPGAVTIEGDGWWTYPNHSDVFPTIATVDEAGNISNPGPRVVNFRKIANWNGSGDIGNVTTVGSAGNESFYGASDMTGNVFEWVTADPTKPDPNGWGPYTVRGGSFISFGHVDIFERNLVHHHNHAIVNRTVGFRVARIPSISELLIDSPPVTLDIVGDVEILAGAEIGVTPGYSQAPATIESILVVTNTGMRTGEFDNVGEHLRDGLFFDAIHINQNDITVDIFQAVAGDINGDRMVDADDIQRILAANSFGNPAGGPYDFTQGDFNGDGLVDSHDIEAILATNLFGKGAYAALPAITSVPEPSSLVLTVLALLGLLAHRRRRRPYQPTHHTMSRTNATPPAMFHCQSSKIGPAEEPPVGMGRCAMRALAMTVCVVVVFGSTSHADTIRLIVIAGQSNIGTSGLAPKPLPSELAPRVDVLYQYRIDALSTSDWGPLSTVEKGGGNQFHASEVTFGHQTADVLSDDSFAIIKYSASGTSLHRDDQWNPLGDAENIYHRMISFVGSAVDQLVADGKTVEPAGFVWVQGSGDAGVLDPAMDYDENLANLAAAVRTDLGAPNLPFIFNQLHVDNARAFSDELRASQAEFEASDAGAVMVNIDDLPMNRDNVHWPSSTHREVGYRISDAFLSTQLLPGDADGDHDIDSDDIQLILAENSFGNAAGGPWHWPQGDTNLDQIVDSADIQNILSTELFGTGRYAARPANLASTVPEPSSVALAAVALVILLGFFRRRRHGRL